MLLNMKTLKTVTTLVSFGAAMIDLSSSINKVVKKDMQYKVEEDKDGKVIFDCGCVYSHTNKDGTRVYLAKPVVL